MINLKLTVAYRGTGYYGWQTQKGGPTVQKTLEDAFRTLLGNQPGIGITGAGRTDSGVHALGQTASLVLNDSIPDLGYIHRKINHILPPDIRILSVTKVPPGFNARFSARAREYRYFLTFNPGLPFFRDYAVPYPYSLDESLLRKCMPFFRGERDFSTFGNMDEPVNPVRRVYRFQYTLKKGFLMFVIVANSFLKGMVRNIIGTILKVNRERQNPGIIHEIFRLKENRYCGAKADPQGLFLYRVYY